MSSSNKRKIGAEEKWKKMRRDGLIKVRDADFLKAKENRKTKYPKNSFMEKVY